MNPAPELRAMIRMKALTKRLGVSRGTIYNWVKAGTFPGPIPMGDNAMAFYEDEVIAWQKEREGQSLAPPRRPLKPIKPRVGLRRPSRPR